MQSTTPAAKPAPRPRDEAPRPAEGERAVPMRALLAACAAAAAVSTPPEPGARPPAAPPRAA
ncbi:MULTISPECIES: hypothetical protein [Kitasatospora]|uniref:Uncharacterized protein n=1 Tax=Kitasatospora cystarginea TaxID=58350 RepID=A0ABN3DGF4_9ACTN